MNLTNLMEFEKELKSTLEWLVAKGKYYRRPDLRPFLPAERVGG